MKNAFLATLAVSCLLLTGCNKAEPTEKLIGVMIDNHEDAREFQRGLEKAPLVQEQLVEGFITRFIAFFDPADLPESVGPVRSVRPYFVDGSMPLISAIFHVGGSPEALEKLTKSGAPESFNALYNLDDAYTYDENANAPHDRFLTAESARKLLADVSATPYVSPGFSYGKTTSTGAALTIDINYYSPLHNVSYAYDPKTKTYVKTSGKNIRPPAPKNILILETDVEVVGPVGRLGIVMEGEGNALLFRDGVLQEGMWSKSGTDAWFVFTDAERKPLLLRKGQVWMIVLDSLDRVSWTPAS